MALTTSDYAALTGHLNEIFNETVKRKVTSWIGKQIFDTSSTDWQTYTYQQLDGVAKFDRVAEGGQFPAATSAQGDSITATQRRYGGRVSITKDMRKFERYGEMDRLVKSNAEYAMNRIDQSMADLLLGGFGTSYTDIYGNTQSSAAPDGVALFSASHSNNQNATTQRNLIRNAAGTANPDLARATIVKARSDAKAHKDANGVNRDMNLDRLIVAPTQEDLAERLVMSSGPAGTPNVDINPLKSSVNNILVWPRLETRGYDATDTSLYWFMADSSTIKDALHAPFAQEPVMSGASEVHDSLNWEYVIDSYYTLFVGDPFGIWGSTSAGD